MSMHAPAARLRPVAVAAVLVLGLGVSGCANYETLEPYQPAAGVQSDAPGVKVRNMLVTNEGGAMHLQGTLIAAEEDALTKISGTALKASGDAADALTIAPVSTIKLPADKSVNLADSKMAVKGDVKPGGMTQISLEFQKAAPLVLTVPVVDAKSAGFETPKS